MRKLKQEISVIDNVILYNLIQRTSTSPAKNKNNFMIFDLSENKHFLPKFQNIIPLDQEIYKEILLNHEIDDMQKFVELSKQLPVDKQDLLSRTKRFFNFICFEDFDTEFLDLINSEVMSHSSAINFSKNKDGSEFDKHNLLHSGYLKLEADLFISKVEQQLELNPEIVQISPTSLKNWRAAVALNKVLRSNKINEIHFTRQSASSFFISYPFMLNYLMNINNASQQSFPNDVLSNRIYFGNWKHASNEEVITSIGITHILNMTSEVDNFFASNPNINYLKIIIDDEETSDIKQHFEETFQFIFEALLESPQNKILIHCAQGKSRSGSIVCMYFMRTYHWTLEETLKYLQDRREVANPNFGFMEQLKAFEAQNFLFDSEISKKQEEQQPVITEHDKDNLEEQKQSQS